MKKLIIVIPFLIFLAGCSGSKLKLVFGNEERQYHGMFGNVPSRQFYTAIEMSDSVNIKWEAEANGGFTQSSPVVYGDYVFVNDLSGRILSFDITTGKTKGQLKHKGPVYTTPIINKYNIVYIESLNDEDKSFLHIHNFLEGRKVAETELEGRVQTEMVMVDKNIYFVTEKGLLYKFSHLGDMYWVKDLKAMVHTSLVSDGVNLYLSTDDKEIISINADNGNVNYRNKTENIITSGLTLNKDNIIAGDESGWVYSISKSDGNIKWKSKTEYKITAVPVMYNEIVYVVNLGGEIASLDINSGSIKWSVSTGGVFNSTPLLTNNYLIIPDLFGKILFADIQNGKIKKEIELPNRAKLSPVIINNILFTGYDRGILRAYEIL